MTQWLLQSYLMTGWYSLKTRLLSATFPVNSCWRRSVAHNEHWIVWKTKRSKLRSRRTTNMVKCRSFHCSKLVSMTSHQIPAKRPQRINCKSEKARRNLRILSFKLERSQKVHQSRRIGTVSMTSSVKTKILAFRVRIRSRYSAYSSTVISMKNNFFSNSFASSSSRRATFHRAQLNNRLRKWLSSASSSPSRGASTASASKASPWKWRKLSRGLW